MAFNCTLEDTEYVTSWWDDSVCVIMDSGPQSPSVPLFKADIKKRRDDKENQQNHLQNPISENI